MTLHIMELLASTLRNNCLPSAHNFLPSPTDSQSSTAGRRQGHWRLRTRRRQAADQLPLGQFRIQHALQGGGTIKILTFQELLNNMAAVLLRFYQPVIL